MSSEAYIRVHKSMTERQKKAMADLYMKGFNANSHVWCTYCDIEDAVVELLTDEEKEVE